jgi:hypothetical protein
MKLASREDERCDCEELRGRSTGAAGSGLEGVRLGVLRVLVLTGALPKPLNTRGLSGWLGVVLVLRPRAAKPSSAPEKALVLKLPLRLARGSGAAGRWRGGFVAEVGDGGGARGEVDELAQLGDLGRPQLLPGDAEEAAGGLAALVGLGGDLEGGAEEVGGVAGDLQEAEEMMTPLIRLPSLADVVGLQRELAERAGVVLGDHVEQRVGHAHALGR